MSKIIVLGHPQSKYEQVGDVLFEYGMQKALPSFRDGFTPNKITETLSKAYNIQSIETVQSVDDIQQVSVAPVWHNMALDLVLANIDQVLWGWCDSQIIYFLEFWKNIDPDVIFVLVYNSPESVFSQLKNDKDKKLEEEIEKKAKLWYMYNTKLLEFFLQNNDRAILVNSLQVGRSVQNYLKQIKQRIDIALLTEPVNVKAVNKISVTTNSVVVKTDEHEFSLANDFSENKLIEYFASNIVKLYPEVQELYEKLQASANLPFKIVGKKENDVSILYSSLSAFLGHEKELLNKINSLEDKISSQEELNKSIEEKYKKANFLADDREKWLHVRREEAKKLQENYKALEELYKKADFLASDREKWLNVRREEAKKLQSDFKALEELYKNADFLATDREKWLNVRREEAKKLQDEKGLLKKEVDRLGFENKSLLNQVYSLQDELERVYESSKKEKQINRTEAEKIKNHLSYRLGNALVNSSKSPSKLAKLPWAVSKEIIQFKKDQKDKLEKSQDKSGKSK